MVTAEDIAKEAGVSRSSVSAVLSGQAEKRRIAKATVQRVLAVAEKMGYRPNVEARNLRKGRTNSIGILLPAPRDDIYSQLISRLNTIFADKGYFSAFSFWDNEDEQKRATESILCRRPEGIITVEPGYIFGKSSVPTVSLFNEDSRFDFVTFDRIGIIKDALSYLIGLGHTRIANPSALQEIAYPEVGKCYIEILRVSGLSTEYVADLQRVYRIPTAKIDKKIAVDTVEWVMSFPVEKRPTALILYRDMTAMYVIREFLKRGVRVPDSISIVSCDNIPFTESVTPSLTSFGDSPEHPLPESLAERIFHRMKNPNAKCKKIFLKRKLYIRESCVEYTGKEWNDPK